MFFSHFIFSSINYEKSQTYFFFAGKKWSNVIEKIIKIIFIKFFFSLLRMPPAAKLNFLRCAADAVVAHLLVPNRKNYYEKFNVLNLAQLC